MAQVDAKLTAALKQAKTKPMCFVFVAKGNEGKLVVDKQKINAKVATEAKKQCGGGTLHKGRCKGEDGLMVFEVGKEVSPTLAALTKKIIKQDAGLVFDVEYRVAADLASEESQGETASEGGEPTAAVSPPEQAPAEAGAQPAAVQAPAAQSPAAQATQPAAGGAETMKRLNAMTAGIKAAMLGPNKAQVQALFVSISGLIKSKNFVQANAALDELEPLVAKPADDPAASAAAVPPAQPQDEASPASAPADDAAPTGADLAAEWQRRVIALEPKILEAQKTRSGEAKWMTMFMNAQDLGSAGEFPKSLAILDKLEGLLRAAPQGKSPELTAALQIWTAARDNAVKQLQAEIAAIATEIKDAAEHKQAAADTNQSDSEGADDQRLGLLAAEAELELKAVVKQLSGTLETKQQAEEMRTYLDKDQVVADVCEMSFDFKSPLVDAIDAIKDRLAA